MLHIFPSRTDFTENARADSIFPVYAEIPYISPKRIYEAVSSPNSVLLESVGGPEKISRYSFIGAEPFATVKVKNGTCEISGDSKKILTSKSPLKILKKMMASYKPVKQKGLPPFTGGALGLISYDFVHYFERLPRTVTDDLDIPDAHFVLVDTAIAVDHKLQKTFIIASPGAAEIISGQGRGTGKWGNYYDDACERIRSIHKKIEETSLIPSGPGEGPVSRQKKERPVHIEHEMGKETYMDIVKKAKEYITAGDIFQANLSQRVSARIGETSPWEIYSLLSSINPSPFAGFLNMTDYFIVSSSPERLVSVMGDTVETRPIAGTRPRGADAEGDRKMRNDLLLNEKERAEHIMLIDLERNDLGKIADYSTVEADELMITEDYSHVIHIVSNLRGTVADGKDSFDVIRATFPGGTITGVPKVRCMEIIDELEPVARGPYTGSIGYISFDGDMDLNIIIRTFVIKNKTAYVQAGAGIVADSDPEREYYETLKKAEALIKTLENL